MKKTPSHILPRINDVEGWILICKDDDSDGWHIAWLDVFGSRKSAREFAKKNGWSRYETWRAVRGQLSVGHQ
jgi:hypothetical protein